MALDIVRRAFFPLHCGAELDPFQESMRIHVVNKANDTVFKLANIERAEFSDSERLGVLLNELRENITQHLSIDLEPWQMPDIKFVGP